MSRSQSSLSLSQTDSAREDGVSPAPNSANPTMSSPMNLSGLVCNVRRTTGREPRALVGATTTILGDKLYVFGGRSLSKSHSHVQLTSDLYELDLIRRHWTKVEVSGDIPAPRYFHSVCALGDTKLVCFGGMSPADPPQGSAQQHGSDEQTDVQVMSDIHIYDVVTRTWTRLPAKDPPLGRYAHCATILPSSACFTSANAPLSAIHNNPSSGNPHQGSIGPDIDGYGGAEMIVVGGQDTSNHYIEQISVFNLRSLKWTSTSPLGRSCGAYRSVVAPLTNMDVSDLGSATEDNAGSNNKHVDGAEDGTSMLIYSNYNFLDVKLELQVRLPDGRLLEKPMYGEASPPGLRFPNGGIINNHLVVSGTYLTSTKQEYSLWALDLRTLTWSRIDGGGTVFSSGSWNRGVLWERRNTFVILGNRRRSLVEDYNHRRINFSHLCMVELEAFGLYNNPCRTSPTSGYSSVSAPIVPASLQLKLTQLTTGGRPLSAASDELGKVAFSMSEMADMELQALGGERIPVSSRMLARRWGPFFIQLLREASDPGIADTATLRGTASGASHPSRNSSITITPSLGSSNGFSNASTLVSGSSNSLSSPHSRLLANLEVPSAHSIAPSLRPRVLYLPHTLQTVRLLVYYLYTSSLPPVNSPLCTPLILCSILQLARPYQVDGLLEATVERLHQVLDGRNAAAVFNAAAMAAGGGRGTGFISGIGGTLEVLNGAHNKGSGLSDTNGAGSGPGGLQTQTSFSSLSTASDSSDTELGRQQRHGRSESVMSQQQRPLRINTSMSRTRENYYDDSFSDASASGASSATSNSFSHTDSDTLEDGGNGGIGRSNRGGRRRGTDAERPIWTGDVSSVIGLQKRGLKGLMEGRRMRERSGGRSGIAVGVDGQ
ncbi:regulatory protein Ral2, putative [Talaromyces stipitatus ATCC 10500]|uniref:Regulatory protein Ral2, putative n=1 Tax=Talaromyces stipitatus (strain ATCC 10500 / CBS 375.48 / QM 6759 / NRRL 1006) TaxID=441959 RepID=B8MHW3_TALSN|nr:regulatory protein Ral2, putative [Talaromyces stipitatus ATCC 10500]EED16443.1 regulatory protein Ral2, putative [Talaromyces stipitatus ATCC 10500]